MKIAFVITGLGTGGAEAQVQQLASRFVELGNTVLLISLAPGVITRAAQVHGGARAPLNAATTHVVSVGFGGDDADGFGGVGLGGCEVYSCHWYPCHCEERRDEATPRHSKAFYVRHGVATSRYCGSSR